MSEDGMFGDSLLETSWSQRTRRNWTTLTSFGVQALLIGLLLLVPLLTTVGLPSARTVSTPISAGRPDAGPPPQTRSRPGSTAEVIPVTSELRFPHRMPATISMAPDAAPDTDPQPTGTCPSCVGSVPGLLPGIPGGPQIVTLIAGDHPLMPAAPRPTIRPIRTSSMMEGNLIRRVEPIYPPLARAARIQGPVVLSAIISKAGTIDNLRVLSGKPMLVPAAIDAVRQWRYRPYVLNGEPVEVETQITVNFILGS